jgi:formylglycine-generating enzyme required for sulfatase activity
MAAPLAFLRFVAKAVLNAFSGGVAGDFAVEVLPEVARGVLKRYGKDLPPDKLFSDMEAAADLPPDEAARAAREIARELANGYSEAVMISLESYLTQVPASIRRSQSCLDERPNLNISICLRRPEDVLPFLPPRVPHFRPGDRPPGVGDWELVEMLGMGGFGEVWKARSAYLKEPAALKFCLDPHAARMLRNEAALLGRVMSQGRHPGIVALLDTYLNGDPPCLKYEYVAGGDLAGLVRERHRRDPGQLIEQAPRLLADLAHTAGDFHRLDPPIVHRDLKPANILVQTIWADDVQLRVADFGIGGVVAQQVLDRTWPGRTSALTSALRGACTPLYASPQQQRGEPPDPRDDVYALGVIWYQMLTGDLGAAPLGDWQDELAQRGVSAAAVKLLALCVASKADKRPKDGAALADELAALCQPACATAVGNALCGVPSGTPQRAFPTAVAHPPEVKTAPGLAPPSAPTEEDLAVQVQRILGRIKEAHTQARHMARRQHDYAGAARLLDGVPKKLRDSGLYAKLCWRRDRVAELDGTVRAAIGAGRLAGLRPEIEELLGLTPEREDLRKLLDLLPEETPLPVRLTNSLGMEFVLIRPGKFFMGSPEGEEARGADEWRHEVELALPFYLGVYPVTQEQYRQATGKSPSHFARTGAGRQRVAGLETNRFPVDSVSWFDAAELCRLLTALPEEVAAQRVYRLPTEAEWEYACRAGSTTPFFFGTSASSARANFDGNYPYGGAPRCLDLQRTERVGRYTANAWGLYDMHGNVGEWCADWYGKDYYQGSPQRSPEGPAEGGGRVVRGGSWIASGRLCRSAQRISSTPDSHYNFVGFRLALVMASPPW